MRFPAPHNGGLPSASTAPSRGRPARLRIRSHGALECRPRGRMWLGTPTRTSRTGKVARCQTPDTGPCRSGHRQLRVPLRRSSTSLPDHDHQEATDVGLSTRTLSHAPSSPRERGCAGSLDPVDLNPSRFGREASAEVATWTSSTNDRSGLVAGHGTPGPELLAGVVVEVAASDPLVAAIAGADRKASTFDSRGVIARQSALAPVQVVARLVPFDLPVPGPPRDPSATRDSLPLPARPGQLAW